MGMKMNKNRHKHTKQDVENPTEMYDCCGECTETDENKQKPLSPQRRYELARAVAMEAQAEEKLLKLRKLRGELIEKTKLYDIEKLLKKYFLLILQKHSDLRGLLTDFETEWRNLING